MVHYRDASLRRSGSRTSVAASDVSYHSFQQLGQFEPASPKHTVQTKPPSTWKNVPFSPMPMRRQDSGYESIPSGSKSGGSQVSSRRTSMTSSSTSSSHHARPGPRPSIHRATRSHPTSRTGYTSGYGLSRPSSQQQSVSYYHFPEPDDEQEDADHLGEEDDDYDDDDDDDEMTGTVYPLPPQTTHYWTSDHTRRLEYAAIDAASQGVKGWMLRHVVPDCFIPKENRRLRFDDDSGSVRRYRLDLDDDVPEKEGSGRKLGWLFGRA